MTEQQQQDPSNRVQQKQPMQELAAAALAQVVLCRNRGLLTSSCLSAQKRRRVSKIKEDSGDNLSMQGVRHTPPKLVKQYVQPLADCLTPEALEERALRWCNKPSEAFLADQKDTSCSLDRYSCLAEVLQYALPSAAPSRPGIRRQSIAQAGHGPPEAPTRKLPSNMWGSAFMADDNHLPSHWSAQLHEMASELRNPLIADPITSTTGLLLSLESARTGSLTAKVLDSASSAYTDTLVSLHDDSSRLPMQPCYREVPSSAQLPSIMEDSFVGCSGALFSKDSKAMPKLLNSAPRPSSPVFRAYSFPLAASDLVLGPHSNSLATPAWPQQTPYSILPNLPRTPIDPSIPVSHPRQALLQPPHHDPSQHFLQGPLPAPLHAPFLAPSQPSFQVPFQPPFQEPFLDDLQPHDWHVLESALSLQT